MKEGVVLLINTTMLNSDYGIPTRYNIGSLQNQPANTNITAPTNFKLVLPKVPNCEYFCTAVSVPGQSCDPVTYQTWGATIKFPGNSVIHGDLTFTFLIDEKMNNLNEMKDWFNSMLAFKDFSQVAPTSDWLSNEGQLIFLNNKKTPVRRMVFRGLFPSLLSGITFKSTDTEVSNMTATCTMSYTYYTLEQL